MNDILFTPLRLIPTAGGDVRHALKKSAPGYRDFGEAYFSTVERGMVKGWKRHKRMTLNLIVPHGEVRFVVWDDRSASSQAFNVTPDRTEAYGRLTVPPGFWLAFGGVGNGLNFVLNIADIEHDPSEAEACAMGDRPWTWS